MVSIKRAPTSTLTYSTNLTLEWYFVIFLLSIFIGLRYEVGGDWYIYENNAIELMSAYSMWDYIKTQGDPGYYLINYLSLKIGAHVYLSNFICAVLFSTGLAMLCRSCPRPLLSLAAAFPYLIIVVAMGYTRQSVAIGFILIAIIFLIKEKPLFFVLMILLATLFHKTALVFLPIGAFIFSKNKLTTLVAMLAFGLIAFFIFLESYLEQLIASYLVGNAQQSSGAKIRLGMNLVPSLIYILFRNKFQISIIESKLFFWLSLISISLFLMLFLTTISTALDRIGLYMLPLQMLIFSRIPDLFEDKVIKTLAYISIFSYFLLVLFVWLNFADHSYLWVPYNSILLS